MSNASVAFTMLVAALLLGGAWAVWNVFRRRPRLYPSAADGMEQVGIHLRRSGVRAVVFAHGTFAGDDPASLARLAGSLSPRWEDLVRRGTKARLDAWLGDRGNFTGAYVDQFAAAGGIPCRRFVWSSENHHVARVRAAGDLARLLHLTVLETLPPRPARWWSAPRLLLVGHSHAGQVFAVLSRLLAGGEPLLLEAAGGNAVTDALEGLQGVHLDVVTLGSPSRYIWACVPRWRALHLVSDGGATDLVRRLGTEGSDFVAGHPADRAWNLRLDGVLDRGLDRRRWLRRFREDPVGATGTTHRVDYGGEGPPLVQLLRSGLGHSHYTRREAMLDNARLIARHFYEPARRRPWAR